MKLLSSSATELYVDCGYIFIEQENQSGGYGENDIVMLTPSQARVVARFLLEKAESMQDIDPDHVER